VHHFRNIVVMHFKLFPLLLFTFLCFSFISEEKRKVSAILLPPIASNDAFMRYSDTTYMLRDESGNTLFYQDIFTPVCTDNTCLPVSITIYWDILGNYHSYGVSKNAPLTKAGHVPFSQEDYEKLDRVLADAYSILGNYTKEDLKQLVQEDKNGKKKENVDAMSGATWKSGQSLVIDGALYTSHTLWKLTHGPIKEKLLHYTKTHLLDIHLMKQCLQSDKASFRRFAIEQLANFEIEALHKEVLHIVQGNDADMSYSLLYQLPSRYYSLEAFTLPLAEHINTLVRYDVKVACLKKLRENIFLNDSTLKALVAQSYVIDPSLLTNVLYVLCKQKQLSKENTKLALALVKDKKETLQSDRFFTRAFQYDTSEMNSLFVKINKAIPRN